MPEVYHSNQVIQLPLFDLSKVCNRCHEEKPLEEFYKSNGKGDGYNCHICGGVVAPSDVHFDHVIPLSRSGPHSEDNIKVAHSVCNLRKGDLFLEDMSPFQRRGMK